MIEFTIGFIIGVSVGAALATIIYLRKEKGGNLKVVNKND